MLTKIVSLSLANAKRLQQQVANHSEPISSKLETLADPRCGARRPRGPPGRLEPLRAANHLQRRLRAAPGLPPAGGSKLLAASLPPASPNLPRPGLPQVPCALVGPPHPVR